MDTSLRLQQSDTDTDRMKTDRILEDAIGENMQVLKGIAIVRSRPPMFIGPGVSKPEAIKPDTSENVIQYIQTGKTPFGDITSRIKAIRANHPNPDKLKQGLPYICASELKGSRKNENFVQTRAMMFDIDHVGDNAMIQSLKEEAILKLPEVYFAFQSPRDGLKLCVLLDSPISDQALYRWVYNAIAVRIESNLGYPCDKTSDPARACFFSHDPDIIVNDAVIPVDIQQMMDSYQTTKPQAESVTPKHDSPQPSQKRAKTTADYEKAKNAVQALCHMKLSHDEWNKVGMALKAGFGEDGKALWDMFLANPHYNDTQADLDAKWRSFKKDGGINIGSLYYICKQHFIPIGDSDDDICRGFYAVYGSFHRYGPELGVWYDWSGSHWQSTTHPGFTRNLSEDMCSYMYSLDTSQKKSKEKLANQNTRVAVLKYMQSYPAFMLYRADMDTHKDVLATKNGVLALSKEGVSFITDEAEMRKYNLSKCLPVDYNPAATCPKWEKFIQEIFSGDTDLIEWLQLYLGAVFLAEPNDKIVIAWGEGANGKTTFFNVLAALFGSYCAMIDPGMFIASKNSSGQSFDPPNLEKTRLAIGNELKDHCYFAEDRLKRFTSKGNYPFHTKGKDIREIPITWSLILVTNKLPGMDFKSDAMKRRMVLLPFKQQFKGDKANQRLEDELKAELPGILNWALLGATSYLSNNRCLPEPPEATRIAFNDYELNSNPIMQFVRENCTVDSNNDVEFKNLYSRYEKWCEENSLKHISKIAFGKSIDGMTVDGVKLRKDKSSTYQNKTYIFGLSLRETDS